MHLPTTALFASSLLLCSAIATSPAASAHHLAKRANAFLPAWDEPPAITGADDESKTTTDDKEEITSEDKNDDKAPFLQHLRNKPKAWLFVADSGHAGLEWQAKFMVTELDRHINFYKGRKEAPPPVTTMTARGYVLTLDLRAPRPMIQKPLPTTMGLFVAALQEMKEMIVEYGIREMAVLVGDDLDGGGTMKIVTATAEDATAVGKDDTVTF